jgi:hypothetical protein
MNPSTATLLVDALPSKSSVPFADFEIVGAMDTRCDMRKPVRGYVQVERAACPIEQIVIQVIRVETVPWTQDEMIHEEAEVVKCQVVDGNIPVGLAVPCQLLLPRLFTAPSVTLPEFSIAFEMNLIVEFADGSVWKGTMDMTLYRSEDDTTPSSLASASDERNSLTGHSQPNNAVVLQV